MSKAEDAIQRRYSEALNEAVSMLSYAYQYSDDGVRPTIYALFRVAADLKHNRIGPDQVKVLIDDKPVVVG